MNQTFMIENINVFFPFLNIVAYHKSKTVPLCCLIAGTSDVQSPPSVGNIPRPVE